MAIAELKEALILLKRMPLLWIPGIIGGLLAAALWVIFNLAGTFFASRLLVISGLVLLVFTTGMLVIIRNNEGDIRTMLAGGIKYYFRVLLPQLVIIFGVMIIVILAIITFGFFGATSDISMVTALSIGFMIPTVILTFFYDTAAVFETAGCLNLSSAASSWFLAILTTWSPSYLSVLSYSLGSSFP
jgi:hypothetical protein